MTKHLTKICRRRVISGISAAGFVLAAPPLSALDRRTIASAARGTVSSCDNSGVMTSVVEGRMATVADFVEASTCQMTPDTVEGPYFICDGVEAARDVTDGKHGAPMTLALRVVDQNCDPIPGAIVDAWECDAEGWYSGHNVGPDEPNTTPGPRRGNSRLPDTSERFLRGVLATDAEGIAEFDMIYPGFYGKRAVHTHYKVHIGNKVFLTAQALYTEEFNERVMATSPYNNTRPGKRTLNAHDASVIVNPGLFTVIERGDRLLSLITLSVQE